MSRYLSFLSVLLLLVIVSCQKEESFEQGKTSKGSLQSSAGDCLSKKVGGTYTATKSLGDSNYIDVTIDVTETGHYTVYTDTLNGYYFSGSGTFSTIGSNTVRMKGFGTPGSAGTNDFTVFYDSSFCSVGITVLPGTGGSGGTAVYTLQSSGTDCMNAVPAGTYTQGVALTSANKITIQVNVTNVGTWNVITPSVAGFSFSGAGTFTTTGVQSITLTASGTPNASGSQVFPVTVGSSSCSFTIPVAAGTTPPLSTDYFPLTQNSYWTYDDGLGSDTLKTTVTGTATIGGKSYQRFISTYESGPPNDTSFYRKDNTTGFYYTIVDTSAFAGLVTFTQPTLDVLFLKNSLATGATWNSDFSAKFQGQAVTVRFKFTCTNANATVTANGKTFSNVYQISSVIQIGLGTFNDISTPQTIFYAKGIGLVKASDPSFGDQVIRYYNVL
jgi:hypothetical protein